MNNKGTTTIIVLLVAIIIVLLVRSFLFKDKITGDAVIPNEFVIHQDGQTDNNSVPPVNQKMTKIKVPLASENDGDFGPFGCGSYLTFVEQEVPETKAVLDATYKWLFNAPVTVGAYHNTVASQTMLNFQKVEIEYGLAKVYLTGAVMANHCGDPVFAEQITQAAFQYPSVLGIEVYVNGEIFDWCGLDESGGEGPCPEIPRLWKTNKN